MSAPSPARNGTPATVLASGRHPMAMAALLTVGVLAFGVWSLALGQDGNWDLRNYHYYNAYAFLNGRWAMDMAAAQVATFYNPTLDVPFYLMAQAFPARVVGFVMGAVQGCNLPLLYLLALRLLPMGEGRWRRATAFAAAVCGMLGGGQMGLLGATFYDNVISLFVLGGLLIAIGGAGHGDADGQGGAYAGVWSAAPSRAYARVVLAGLLLGAGVGLKQPTLPFAVGTCFAFLLAGGGLWRRFFLAFFFGVGVLVGMALFSGHWLWFLWSHYANPLFPYFNDVFRSPWGTLAPYRDDKFIPHGLADILLFPLSFSLDPKLVGEIVFRDYRVLAAYVVGLLTLALGAIRLLSRRAAPVAQGAGAPSPVAPSPVAGRYVLAAAGLSYLVWLKLFAIYRYLIPLEMLAPVLIVVALRLWPLPSRVRHGVGLALLALLVATGKPGTWGRVPFGDKIVMAQAPEIPRPDHTMILVTGYSPSSFLIPSFPHQIPFLRVQSYFIHPDQGDIGLNREIRARVDKALADGDDFYLMMARWEGWTIEQVLHRYGLTSTQETCRPIPNNLDDTMRLCHLVPLKDLPPPEAGN